MQQIPDDAPGLKAAFEACVKPIGDDYSDYLVGEPPCSDCGENTYHRKECSVPRALDDIKKECSILDDTNTEKAGGSRFSSGKPGGWWYAPLRGLVLVSKIWAGGAGKYSPMDYKNGQSYSTLLDCAFRHFLIVLDRGPWAECADDHNYDGRCKPDCLHVGHLVWNILTLMYFMVNPDDDARLNDVDRWRGVTSGEKAAKLKEWGTEEPEW